MTCCDYCLEEGVVYTYKIDEEKFDCVAKFCSYKCAQRWKMGDEEIEKC